MVRVGSSDPSPFYPDDGTVETSGAPPGMGGPQGTTALGEADEADAARGPNQATSNLPPAPVGDPLAASATKARLMAFQGGSSRPVKTGSQGAKNLPPDEQDVKTKLGDEALKGYQQTKQAAAEFQKNLNKADGTDEGKIFGTQDAPSTVPSPNDVEVAKTVSPQTGKKPTDNQIAKDPDTIVDKMDPNDPLNDQELSPGARGLIEEERAQQRNSEILDSLGMPPEPPQITSNDVGKLDVGAGSAQGLSNEQMVGLAGHYIAVAQGMETAATGAAAGGLALGGLAVAIGGGWYLGKSIRETLDAPGEARDRAITKAETEMAVSASQLVNQKFPGKIPELNQRGQQQVQANLETWQDTTAEKLNPILEKMQAVSRLPVPDSEKKIIMDKLDAQLQKTLKDSTADLANSQMKKFYDPRNWKSGS